MTDIITKRAVTYSVLAHIKNSGQLADGPLDIFIPLVKKSLHYLNSEQEQYKGENISEIRTVIEEQYGIDFPLPVLKSILQKLAKEINSEKEKVFDLYQDGAFWIKAYIFDDYDEQLKESKRKVQELQNAFKDFCRINNVNEIERSCIIKFIEKNRISISRYLTLSSALNGENFTIAALFVEYFKNIPNYYKQIRDLYLGSTLICALDYEFSETKTEVTLLLDTNFVVSLLDLDTPESTHTCEKLLEVCKKIGYKFQILPETIDEIKSLIRFKSDSLDKVVLSKFVNRDIFNACERRKLSKVDLDRICDNLEATLEKNNIVIIANTDSLKNKARFSNEYKFFKPPYRNSEKAALHDAMAIIYVKEKRGKRVKEFEKVNCWFVNNSITDDGGADTIIDSTNNHYQPEIIRADNLLNILWLSNPSINTSLANSELVDMGLTSLVAFTLNESLPKTRIIKELDGNIQKYKSQDITDRDVYLLSSRIANNQVHNIESLNELANRDTKEFNRRIKEEADKQEKIEADRTAKLDELFRKMEVAIDKASAQKGRIEQRVEAKKQKEIDKIKAEVESEMRKKDTEIEKLKQENAERKERVKAEKREQFIAGELKKWRKKSWIWLSIISFFLLCGIIWIIIISSGNLIETNKVLQNKFIAWLLSFLFVIIEGFIIKSLYDKYQNHPNINAYKENIIIPEDLK